MTRGAEGGRNVHYLPRSNADYLRDVAGQLGVEEPKAKRSASKSYQRRIRFADYLDREEAKALKTIRLYVRTVERVEDFMHDNSRPALARCRWEDLRAYIQQVPNTHASLSVLDSALKAYFRYIGKDIPGKLRIPRAPKMISRAVEPEDMAKALAVSAADPDPSVHAFFCLGYYAGFRVHEIAQAKWSDIGEDGWISVLGKGNKHARLPIAPPLLKALERLPRKPVEIWGPWVFPGRTPGTHVAPNTVRTSVRYIGERAGIPRLTPHVLRHTAITEAYEGTGDLRAAQAFARHEDPQVTAGYARFRQARLIDITQRALVESVTDAAHTPGVCVAFEGVVHVTGNEIHIGNAVHSRMLVREVAAAGFGSRPVVADIAGMRLEGRLEAEPSNDPTVRPTLRIGRHNVVSTLACYDRELITVSFSERSKRKPLRTPGDDG